MKKRRILKNGAEQKVSRCCIFAGGKIKDYSTFSDCGYDLHICADAGYVHAVKLKIKPDIILGDFDTFEGEFPKDCEIVTF